MKKKENAVLTVVGRDEIGTLAKVAVAVANAKGNVVQMSQIVMGDFFTITMLIELSEIECTIHELEKSIKESLPHAEVHLMHENIFTSMHTI